MKAMRFLLPLWLLGTIAAMAAMASTASAEGAVSLSWDMCTGPIDKEIAPGSQAKMFASVLGHDQPHLAYQVWLRFSSGFRGPIRDAWRFDAAGCQGSSRISIDHFMPLPAKTCPIFQGALSSLQLKEYQWDPLTGWTTTYLANTYPAGNTTQVNPAQRYFLVSWTFDHTLSVDGATTPGADCGGLDVPVCCVITRASWLTLDGVEHAWPIAREWVTSRDPNGVSCTFLVPAENRTWGALKAQYKR